MSDEFSAYYEINDLLRQDGEARWINAANRLLKLLGNKGQCALPQQGKDLLAQHLQWLLDNDGYLQAACLLWGKELFKVRGCVRRIFKAWSEYGKLFLQGASGCSKCLGPEVPVMFHDGSVKPAKEVRVGDKLMGDDGKAREVLSCRQGRGHLYRIVPERGMPWICNDAHILSLRCSTTRPCGPKKYPSRIYVKNSVHDVPIKNYLGYSKNKKNILKQFHVGVDCWPDRPVPFDPYIYGCWLGDGGFDTPSITKTEGPITQAWCSYFESLGYRISRTKEADGKCSGFFARKNANGFREENPFTSFIRTSRKNGEKIILQDYLVNSRENRMKLLAGLLDTDGTDNRNSWIISSKYESMARQISWLARSLGFASTVNPFIGRIKSIGFEGRYWMVYIGGHGVDKIPTKQKRTCAPTALHQNMNNTGFSVEDIGVGDYCGFEIDGNHRFLLGDFTVTHNSFSSVAWLYLDYRRDPEFTSVRIISISEGHLKENAWTFLMTLHNQAAIKGPQLEVRDLFLGKDPTIGFKCIKGVAFGKDQEIAGRLIGYKIFPERNKPHPQFGRMTRIRVFVDEFNKVSPGIMRDFRSVLSGSAGREHIKVGCAYNPYDIEHVSYSRAEPKNGWQSLDPEKDQEWDTKDGWKVFRFDALHSESVTAKESPQDGFMTYQGFMELLKGGDNTADYWCYGRGLFPMKGSSATIIALQTVLDARKIPIWEGEVTEVGSLDSAMIRDKSILTKARYGRALGLLHNTEKQMFDRPRYVFYVEQQIEIPGCRDEFELAHAVKNVAVPLGIAPEWFVVDKTGNAQAVFNDLKRVWGDITGILWSTEASEIKILATDTELPKQAYAKVNSEMWFCTKRWLERGLMFINPAIPAEPLFSQMTSRRKRQSGAEAGKVMVETKQEYRARGHDKSPDEVDSLIMGPMLIRLKHPVIPGGDDTPVARNDGPVGMWVGFPDWMVPPQFRVAGELQQEDNQRQLETLVNNPNPAPSDQFEPTTHTPFSELLTR